MAAPLSRQQQQYLQQQQEKYFSSGLATPPPPLGASASASMSHPTATSSPYFASPPGAGAGAGFGGSGDGLRTPVRYYDSYNGGASVLSGSGYSPTFLSPGAAAAAYPSLGAQIPHGDGSLSGMGVRSQMSSYWQGAGMGVGRTTPPFSASFAGSPIPQNTSLHYEDYFHPGLYSHTHSPGVHSLGRKSDGFEPMNTSPTVQQQQVPWQWQHSPSRGFSGMAPHGHGQVVPPSPSQMGGFPPGGPVLSPPPQQQQQYFAFFGHNLDSTPPPGPSLVRTTSLKDLTSGVGASDIAAAAAAFHRSKQLFETPPKGGSGANAGVGASATGAAANKTGPPVFGLGNYDVGEEDGPRILRHASSSPNLIPDKRRGEGSSSSGSGGKKSRHSEFGVGGSTSMLGISPLGLSKSSSAPVSPASSGGSGANSPTLSNWVTVFGFSAAATSYIISHFGQFGTVLETKCVPGSNWIHIRYSNKFEARKALNKNGAVIGGNMMLGIMPYDPDMDEGGPTPTATAKSSATSVQIQPVGRPGGNVIAAAGGAGPSSGAGASVPASAVQSKEVKARLRPLAHTGYLGTNPLPKENNGILSRALEFLFGW